jgi:Tol biopolymer transport system component
MYRRPIWILLIACILLRCSKPTKPPPEPPPEQIHLVEGWPSWSPDGQFIYYTRPVKDESELIRYGQHSIWAYDTQTQRYGFLIGPGMFPKVNPDGTILAFNWGNSLFFYYFSSREVRQVTSGINLETFAWAPNGRSLILANGDARIIDTLGNLYAHLLPWDGSHGGWRGNGDGQWSTTGEQLIMPSSDTLGYWSVIIIDSLGGIVDTIVRPESPRDIYDYASWSPDESKIGVNFSFIRSDGYSASDLRILNRDGSLNLILSHDAGMAEWSPDGSKIVFQKYTFMGQSPNPGLWPDFGRVTVWICNSDGSDMHELLGWPQPRPDTTMFNGGYNWVTDTYNP